MDGSEHWCWRKWKVFSGEKAAEAEFWQLERERSKEEKIMFLHRTVRDLKSALACRGYFGGWCESTNARSCAEEVQNMYTRMVVEIGSLQCPSIPSLLA